MKTKFVPGALLLLTAFRFNLFAAVITSDTVINPNDASYDNQPVVISNCVVAVNGPHTFESLQVAAGGTLTHSFSPNGTINLVSSVSDEPQTLLGTNAATLANSNVVLSSVILRDFSIRSAEEFSSTISTSAMRRFAACAGRSELSRRTR